VVPISRTSAVAPTLPPEALRLHTLVAMKREHAHILVVDDDDDHRDALVACLRAHGYSVLGAENGKVALEALASYPRLPQAIVLDLAMPLLDGHDFVAILRAHAPLAHIPVVIVSARPPDEWLAEVPFTRFLQKPCDVTQLLATLHEVVQRFAGAGAAAPTV
jgi:CheY-like chemotaxis protein